MLLRNQKIKKPKKFLKKYVEAAGGKEAFVQVQNIVSTSELLFLKYDFSMKQENRSNPLRRILYKSNFIPDGGNHRRLRWNELLGKTTG
jgi:hypothetical protein